MIPSRRVSFFGTGSDRLNDTVVNTVRHLFRRGWPRGFFLFGMLLPLLFGCIREDRSDCFPVAETRFVVLKIVDEATGQDITQTGEAGSAVLYLFSQGGRFVDRISVTRERIMKRAPIPLPDGTPGRCRAVVWANAGTGQRFHSPAAGSRIEDRAVSLIEEDDTFHHTPDDLFFGRARLGPTGEAASEEITLIRKNARIHITARGTLPKTSIISRLKYPTTVMILRGIRSPERPMYAERARSATTGISRPTERSIWFIPMRPIRRRTR